MNLSHYFRNCSVIFTTLLISACSGMQEKLDEKQQALAACQQLRVQEQGKWLRKFEQQDKHLEECQLNAREIISDSNAAQQREQELRQILSQELNEKNVELEYLKGRLTIRMLDRILFESGSARIISEGKQVLDKLATTITRSEDLIRVVGHTDDIRISTALQKKYPSNWELSAARASSVVRYFQENHGIDPLRMEAVGVSKYRPVTENLDTDSRQRNRRVEIILTARDQ